MPTPTMSDEELDSVFRRVADEYPPEAPPPGAWEGVADQLATAAATQQLRGKVLRAFGVELAVLLLLLWQGARLLLPARVGLAAGAALPATAAGHAAGGPGRSRPAATGVAASPAGLWAGSPATAEASALPAGPTGTHGGAALAAVPTPGALSNGPATRRTGVARPAASPVGASASPAAIVHGAASAAWPTAPTRGRATPALPTTPPVGRASPALSTPPGPGAARHWPQAGAGGRARALRSAAPDEPAHPGRQSRLLSTTNEAFARKNPAAKAAAKAEELPQAGLAETLAGKRAAQLAPGADALPDSLRGLAWVPPADSTKAQTRRAPRPPYRLVLGLLGAPSVSAVRTPQSAQLGGDYGLTLEYRFAPRLRVRAGLISSQKRYRAASSDYEAPAAWQWFPGDYMLDATCRITELPLDLRFDVLRRPAYAVFTSLGVNSLLMRNEQYSYDWTMNGQTFTKTARVVNGSTHFLGVLNLSVGVERPLGGRWSAQVEPFWQLPLGRVGAGQVRLSSAGAAFALKFGLIR